MIPMHGGVKPHTKKQGSNTFSKKGLNCNGHLNTLKGVAPILNSDTELFTCVIVCVCNVMCESSNQ